MSYPTPVTNRCSPCDRNWPATSLYETCPICTLPTWETKGERPMEASESKKLREAYAGWRAYCAKEGLDAD